MVAREHSLAGSSNLQSQLNERIIKIRCTRVYQLVNDVIHVQYIMINRSINAVRLFLMQCRQPHFLSFLFLTCTDEECETLFFLLFEEQPRPT